MSFVVLKARKMAFPLVHNFYIKSKYEILFQPRRYTVAGKKNSAVQQFALFKLDYSEQLFPNQNSARSLFKGIQE
jgi:hypothetical protein